jgi:hypothetical protein
MAAVQAYAKINAAGSWIDRGTQGQIRRELIIGIDESREPHAGAYGSDAGSAERGRFVGIPYGMTVADGLRAVGGCTEEELADPKLQVIVDWAEIWTLVH